VSVGPGHSQTLAKAAQDFAPSVRVKCGHLVLPYLLRFAPDSIQRNVVVSVVVSIRLRKMFLKVREMVLSARHAEQDVRERQASRNF
jgi:hypothetical protein